MAKKEYYMDRVAKLRGDKKKGTTGELESSDQEKGESYTPSSDRKKGLDKLISNMKDVSDKVKEKKKKD